MELLGLNMNVTEKKTQLWSTAYQPVIFFCALRASVRVIPGMSQFSQVPQLQIKEKTEQGEYCPAMWEQKPVGSASRQLSLLQITCSYKNVGKARPNTEKQSPSKFCYGANSGQLRHTASSGNG